MAIKSQLNWLFVIFLLASTNAWADDRPAFSRQAAFRSYFSSVISPSSSSLAPEGWRIEHKQSADLNGDGISDLILILTDASSSFSNSTEGPGRALVFLVGAGAGHFRNAGIGFNALQREDTGVFVDTEMRIQNNVVVIREDLHARDGFGLKTLTQRWRIEKEKPRLIGLTNFDFTSGPNESEETDQNLLTGEVRYSSFDEFDEHFRKASKVLRLAPKLIYVDAFEVSDGILQSENSRGRTLQGVSDDHIQPELPDGLSCFLLGS